MFMAISSYICLHLDSTLPIWVIADLSKNLSKFILEAGTQVMLLANTLIFRKEEIILNINVDIGEVRDE